jgi:hypothetical protein
MKIGKRTIDCSFYNHLPKVRVSGDRADATQSEHRSFVGGIGMVIGDAIDCPSSLWASL